MATFWKLARLFPRGVPGLESRFGYSQATRKSLLRYTLNSKSAERRILFADFERCLIVCAIEPSLQRFVAVPNLNSNSLWRRTLHCRYRLSSHSRHSSYGYEATASRFDGRLSLWGEFFCVSIGVRHIDFSDEVNRRLRLSMYALDSRTTYSRSRNQFS